MIAMLKGSLARKDAAGTIVIDSGAVGYRVFVSLNTLLSMPEIGSEVQINTITVVRDDAIHLYGFSELQEMVLFNLLLQVKGVGPRMALAILGGLKVKDLCSAISREDAGWISTVPGVGKKTAERIILELKDKVEAEPGGASSAPAAEDQQLVSDAVSALSNLGYRVPEGRDAVRRIMEDMDHKPSLDVLIRECLKSLSGRKTNG